MRGVLRGLALCGLFLAAAPRARASAGEIAPVPVAPVPVAPVPVTPDAGAWAPGRLVLSAGTGWRATTGQIGVSVDRDFGPRATLGLGLGEDGVFFDGPRRTMIALQARFRLLVLDRLALGVAPGVALFRRHTP